MFELDTKLISEVYIKIDEKQTSVSEAKLKIVPKIHIGVHEEIERRRGSDLGLFCVENPPVCSNIVRDIGIFQGSLKHICKRIKRVHNSARCTVHKSTDRLLNKPQFCMDTPHYYTPHRSATSIVSIRKSIVNQCHRNEGFIGIFV